MSFRKTDIISENHLRAGFDDGKDKRHLSRTNDQEPDTNQPLTNSEDRGYLSSLVTPVKSVVTEVFGDIPKVVEHMKALLVLCANQIRVNEGFHHHNLKITNAEDDFFGHKTYREWANDVLTMFQGDHVVAQYAIILTLTNEHFHADMGVRSMLEKAITLYPIKRELVDLEDAQIKYWADKDMLPSNVFKWLNFNKDNVLDRRLLAQWTAFLTHRHENSLDKDLVDDEKVYEMLIKEMAKMYKTSDLVDIIVKAEKKEPQSTHLEDDCLGLRIGAV
ncbi:unnamed protein product [Peronospora belbahrii]|uniref:Uncharacterized protein n=1 Tax=Peronospora belbahrii TaxID=622444 RepID=A0AAU9KPI3_9STRA|nr:unnamed protein product [Peronospora belbahrii]